MKTIEELTQELASEKEAREKAEKLARNASFDILTVKKDLFQAEQRNKQLKEENDLYRAEMSGAKDAGWKVVDFEGAWHVLPEGEDARHNPSDCKCGAIIDEYGIVIHSSFDGREKFERGERLPS